MTTPELPVLLNLYAQIAPGELFRWLQRNLGITKHQGIYTPRVLIWMMILQRLDGRGTLASPVEPLASGQWDALLSRCKRVRERNIARSTGGYCQARQNLPKMLLERSVNEILQRLRNHLSERIPLLGRPVYVLDGSSLQLDYSTGLKGACPPARKPAGQTLGEYCDQPAGCLPGRVEGQSTGSGQAREAVNRCHPRSGDRLACGPC